MQEKIKLALVSIITIVLLYIVYESKFWRSEKPHKQSPQLVQRSQTMQAIFNEVSPALRIIETSLQENKHPDRDSLLLPSNTNHIEETRYYPGDFSITVISRNQANDYKEIGFVQGILNGNQVVLGYPKKTQEEIRWFCIYQDPTTTQKNILPCPG